MSYIWWKFSVNLPIVLLSQTNFPVDNGLQVFFWPFINCSRVKKNAAKGARLPNQPLTWNGFHFTILKKFLFHVKEVFILSDKMKNSFGNVVFWQVGLKKNNSFPYCKSPLLLHWKNSRKWLLISESSLENQSHPST